MSKWLSLTHYRKILQFLGPRVVRYFYLGVLIGTVLFLAELAFAYGLQSFLVQLGVMNATTIRLPRWIPQSSLTAVLVFIFAVGTLRALLQWGQIYLQGAGYEYLREHLRMRVLKWAFHSESTSSSEVTDLFNEKIGLASKATEAFQTVLILGTTGGLLGLTLFALSPLLTAVSVLSLVLISIPLKAADSKIKDTGRGLSETWSRTNRRMTMNIKNLLLMQIYGTQQQEESLAAESLSSYRGHAVSFNYLSGMKFALPQIIGVFLLCFITLAANSTNALKASALISYFYLFMRLLQTMSSINLNLSIMLNSWPQLEAVSKWWADHSFDGVRNPVTLDNSTKAILPFESPIGWKVSAVSFRYPSAKTSVISDLTLNVKPATTVVFTGPSGVGKSTLLNLMIGGTKPTSGTIEILSSDGKSHPILDEKKRLQMSLGFVGPESFLIEDSIYQNVIYGLQFKPTKEEVEEALSLAECQFVWSMAGGLDYQLTDQGQGLSAGQKQRLSLARALLRKPKILILDEPTANLDSEMETKLVDTLSKLKSKMTILAVSHRPALLRIADQHVELSRN